MPNTAESTQQLTELNHLNFLCVCYITYDSKHEVVWLSETMCVEKNCKVLLLPAKANLLSKPGTYY